MTENKTSKAVASIIENRHHVGWVEIENYKLAAIAEKYDRLEYFVRKCAQSSDPINGKGFRSIAKTILSFDPLADA